MIIHSIIPYEKIFEGTCETKAARYGAIKGGLAEISDTEYGPVISRLISTDPSVYLDASLAPGSPYVSPNSKHI